MRSAWRRFRWVVMGAVLAVSMAGCAGDPTQSEPYLDLDAERESLEAQVADLRTQLDAVSSELDALLATAELESVEGLATQLTDIEAERNRATRLLDDLAGQIDDAEGRSDELADSLAVLQEAVAQLELMEQQLAEGAFE